MPDLARRNVDYAGGLLIQGSSNVFVEGSGVVRVGDLVQPHGSHVAPITITQGSSKVFVDGNAVCRVGDRASCGHTISSGSSKISVG
ncbi:hypothetical protein [Caulobacter phage Cr30]|uniref:PAAR motif of membran proteins n=1 Tax=Caulobacter phage Cr30 TaxID=1357714 RepID=UPI0004A9B69D|nr:PAAR motif of membran proteins [Caulobacter phage Cr30]AGS81100.1 hypothetical protein [Caulobacter phage Cr30]